MKTIIAKKQFTEIWFDPRDFTPYRKLFVKNELYNITKDDEDFVIINSIVFSKNPLINPEIAKYIYNYFYTKKQLRKEKLLKIKQTIKNIK